MNFLRSILLGALLCAPLAAVAVDMGSMLGVETEPCASTFSDDNTDGIIDAADVTTALTRPVVGVIEVSLVSVYRYGPAIHIGASFANDLPTTFTRTVVVPPPGCFLPPVTPVQRQLPSTALDVGTTPVLTLGGIEYPLIVNPEVGGNWQLFQNFVGDFEEAPATLRFPGGADIAPFEVSIERHTQNLPLNSDLLVGPHMVNYRRFDEPFVLDFGPAADQGVWQLVQVQRTSTEQYSELQFDGYLPGTGLQQIPPHVLAAMDSTPNLVRLILTSVRERLVPVELTDGSPASVVVRYSRGGSYAYNIYPILHPVVETVSLNLGSATTTRTDVALRFEANTHFTHYQIALDPDFIGTEWTETLPPGIRPTFIDTVVNIPATPGEHTVYIRIRNERGTSETASATIQYAEPTAPQLTALSLQETLPIIYRRGTWLNLAFSDEPTHIRISRSADFGDATWLPLSPATIDGVRRYPYTIPGSNGIVTLHVQLKNGAGESNVMTTSIEMSTYGG